ncbi:head GIN domain-containing protein [Oscillatoria amoena NRMC-F 0135]|nr:head GIN domain-containing protein [Oscillatoria amoena NRMC-F 0135]
MKKLLLFILFVYSCSGLAQTSQNREVGSFSGIKVAEGIDVYLKKGNKAAVRLEVTGTNPENVITETSGGYLKIHMASGSYKSRTVKAYVTYVDLEKISASSASNVFSEDVIKARNLSFSASSAASIDVSVEAATITVSASSAADVDLRGKADQLTVDVSSSGEVDAYDLESKSVTVQASSAGTAKVNVTDELSARASSAGSVRYKGNPSRSNTNSSSGGSVKKIS